MGRPLRLDYDGACQHIIVKGINGQYIFKSQQVKSKFIDILLKYKEKYGVKLFAYCLMDNHIHLFMQSAKAIREDQLCISVLMRDVLSNFARWYNKKFNRTGPLFNSRFKSFLCESTPYFIYIIDYIHRNPVNAYKTKTYAYKHSSYRQYAAGNGICDIADACKHIGMTLTELNELLNERMLSKSLPLLNKLLLKIRQRDKQQTLDTLFTELEFRFEDFRGSRIAKYFAVLRKELINELYALRKMRVVEIANYFDISTTYVYRLINSS